MLKLAIGDIPHFQISTLELDHKGPSYTIDTIRKLQKPNTQYRLLLSEEAAEHLDRWKEADELVRLAPPIIGARGTKKGYTATQIMEISSTEIRARLQKNLYVGHLLPAKTLDYIKLNHLYSF